MRYKAVNTVIVICSLILIAVGIFLRHESYIKLNDEYIFNSIFYIYDYEVASYLTGEDIHGEKYYEMDYLYEVRSLAELSENSDLIVVVEVLSRIQYNNMIETKCEVKKVIRSQGNEVTEFSFIYIFEDYNIRIDQDSKKYIYTNSFLTPMKEHNEYTVFLKQIDGYEEDDRFYFTSLLYGYYPSNRDVNILNISNDFLLQESNEFGTIIFDFSSLAKYDCILPKFEQLYDELSAYQTNYCNIFGEINFGNSYQCVERTVEK